LFLASCACHPQTIIKERLVKVPGPTCEIVPLSWNPDFEALNRPAKALLAEFDARADALAIAGAELSCYRAWKEQNK
jgi:hypothetical protein